MTPPTPQARHDQLGVPRAASGVQFTHNGVTLDIDTALESGRIAIIGGDGRRAAIVMPRVMLEGVLRCALDRMALASRDQRRMMGAMGGAA